MVQLSEYFIQGLNILGEPVHKGRIGRITCLLDHLSQTQELRVAELQLPQGVPGGHLQQLVDLVPQVTSGYS